MKQNTLPCRRLEDWGAAWFLTGQMAIAFARCLLRLSEKDPRRALESAALFELWLAAALAKVSCEIDARGLYKADAQYVRGLHGAAHCFTILILFVQHLKRQFAAKAAQLPSAGFAAFACQLHPSALRPVPAIIDTS